MRNIGATYLLVCATSIAAMTHDEKYLVDGHKERVSFTARAEPGSKNTIIRHGILIRRPDAQAVILICHGFMCSKDDIQFLSSLFSDYTTLTFDFRAHGENIKGQYCTFGLHEAEDVIGAVQWIRSDPELRHLPIIAYGFSMGAVASLMAESIKPGLFTAAIWDCPFDSTENVLSRSIDRLSIRVFGREIPIPGRDFLKHYACHPYVQSVLKAALKSIAQLDATPIPTCIQRISPKNAARSIKIPSFLIICRNDEKVPISAVRGIYDSLNEYKRLWITNGRRHFDSYFNNPEKYRYKVNQFIAKVLDGSYRNGPLEKILEDAPQATPAA